MEEANEVDIDGSHSDFAFGKVHTLLSDGGFTDFEIDELQNADFDTNFGDIEIGLLGLEGNFDMQHGSIDIDNVSSSTHNLDFDVQHTSVYLDLKQDFELDFDGQFAKPKISEEHEELFEQKEATELSERLSLRPLKDLRRAMGINERILTTNELFDGNGDALKDTLTTLNGLNTFDEAKDYLSNIAGIYDWTSRKKKKKAQIFIKMVRRKFL